MSQGNGIVQTRRVSRYSMTQNRRIVLNIVATYGRSLYTLVLGVFSSRWAVMALGDVDFGLFGVVGGLTLFVSFINSWLATAIGRFYAVSIGQASASGTQDGLESCRRWFNVALSIHLVVPLALIIVGYPIGVWAVRNWLVIPPERLSACVWIFRFACLSCFVGMINVPFSAMYTAKQYIAELTIYSVVSATVKTILLYIMVTHPGDWLVSYSLGLCLISVIPNILICWRAMIIFDECRIRLHYLFNFKQIREVVCFAGWNFLGALGWLLQSQGLAVLVNKYFGPRINAAMSVGNVVNGQANTLSSALTGAFLPAITTAFGAGEHERMRLLAYRACKFGVALQFLFLLPLALEIQEVIRIWLKQPPPYTAGICLCLMVSLIAGTFSVGHMAAIIANGKVAKYQTVTGCMTLSILPIAWMLAALDMGIYAVVLAAGVVLSAHTVVRVCFARYLVKMSISHWVFKIVSPLALVAVLSALAGIAPRLLFGASVYRVFVTTSLVEIVYIPLCWLLVLDANERDYVKNAIQKRFHRKGMA